MSVFDKYVKDAWPIEYSGHIHVPAISGGVPADEKIAEGWIRTKMAPKDDLLRAMVAETMATRNVDAEEAAKLVDEQKHVNGFKRDSEGLYIEGRQLKAAIKEAASIAVASGKLNGRGWGTTNKGLQSFLAEHVVVAEERLHLGTSEASGINQRFIHKVLPRVGRISAIHYEEYVEEAEIDFTILTDFDFSEKEWAMIWLTGEQQGLGASRSQGFGRYKVTNWELVGSSTRSQVHNGAAVV